MNVADVLNRILELLRALLTVVWFGLALVVVLLDILLFVGALASGEDILLSTVALIAAGVAQRVVYRVVKKRAGPVEAVVGILLTLGSILGLLAALADSLSDHS